ncbi:hypothetical protein KAJ27_01250, partial [bacterium]|nr:hypothetical protein [bacterium]
MSKTLSSITLDSIEHLASSVSALERGRELCNNQKVSDLNVKCNSIAAKVNEKNNIYNVVVNIFNNHIYNYCNCSTDSPGCSHVIATLLEWLGTAEVNSDNGKSLLFQNLNLLDIIKEESPKIVMLAYKMVTENRVNIQTHGEYVIIGTVGEENVKIGSTIGSYTPRYYCSCSCNKLESRCIHSLAVKLAILQKYSPEEVPGNFDIELEELLYYERLNNLSAVLCEPDSDKIKKQYQIFFRIGVQEKALKLELCKAQFLKNGGFGKLTPATENFVDQNFDSFPTDIKHVLILMKLSLKKQVLFKEQKNNNMIITEFEDNADIEILNCLKTIYLENPGIFKNAEFPEEKAYMEIHLLPNIDGSSFDLKLFAKMKHSIYSLRDDRVILLDNKTRMWITVTRKDSIQVIYQLQGQKTFTELIKYLLKLNNMRIRQEDIIEFIEKYYISLSSIGNVVLPEKYRIEAIDNVDPIPRIYLKEFGNQLTMDLKFGYCKSSEAAYGTRHDIVIRDKDSNLRCIKRKLKREEELYLMLHEHGVIRKYGVLTPDIDPYEWLFFKTEELIKNGFEIYGQQKLVNYRTTTASPNMSLYVSNGIDWFDLKGEVSYGQEKIDLSKLMHALVKNEKYVKLSNGVMGAIPEKWLNRMTQLSGLMKKKGDRIFAARSQIGIIETLLEISTKSQIDDKVNTILDKFKEFETIEAVDLPENFNGELREYQKAGYDWLNFLKNFSFGGCLADDMGLG